MKLKLKSERDVHILGVAGTLDEKSFAVLHAGITKLFKTGKNKIILDLAEAEVHRPEPLHGLTELNHLARELAGEIVIVGAASDIAEELRHAAGAGGIVVMPDVATALQRLLPPLRPSVATPEKPSSIPEKAVAANESRAPLVTEARAPSSPAPSHDLTSEKLQAEVLQLRSQLREKEGGELAKLRQESALCQEQNNQLKLLLERLVLERRSPPNEAAYQAKIRSLETEMEETIQRLAAATPAAKA